MNPTLDAGSLRRRRSATRGLASLPIGIAAAPPAGIALPAPAHAAPPAGTTIGNQATATYQDAAANTYTVSSNPVTTIVQQVASLTLTADGVRVAAPGGQAVFPHVITNTGNGSDTF